MNGKQLGTTGENIVEKILSNRGFNVLNKNIRLGRSEFDVVACKNNKLLVFEVKSRRKNTFGAPEESVTTNKLNNFERCYYDLVSLYGFERIDYVIATVVFNSMATKCKVRFIKIT